MITERDVYKVPSSDEAAVPTPPKEPSPAEKLVKYFPAEALALYAALDPLARTMFDTDLDDQRAALWVSLGLALVLCIATLRAVWHVQRVDQVAISCGALVLYVASLGGPFALIDDWKPAYALAAGAVATAFLALVPSPTRPPG